MDHRPLNAAQFTRPIISDVHMYQGCHFAFLLPKKAKFDIFKVRRHCKLWFAIASLAFSDQLGCENWHYLLIMAISTLHSTPRCTSGHFLHFENYFQFSHFCNSHFRLADIREIGLACRRYYLAAHPHVVDILVNVIVKPFSCLFTAF